jgi:acid stress-induced BolA-like protein IbaG/YrbA
MNIDLIKQRLSQVPNLDLINVDGDGMHFQIMLVSTEFSGKTKLARQRLVYSYLKDWLADGSLHAVELTTLTPQEWENKDHE